MLTFIYKLISKLLARHLQPFMHGLVDREQSGFIKGHKILDNILALKVGKEYIKLKKLLALVLKVDFMKAYDRLDHIFLREVLRALGLSEFFIGLVMGLVCNGLSKIHANGFFTKEIPLERGVHQGCPLAPLLFALASQPLMSLLSLWESEGHLRGIPIGNQGEKSLLYQLFANDTNLFLLAEEDNFQNVVKVISIYEQISGTRLNLEKSTILLLDDEPHPVWFVTSGCKAA